MKILTKEQIVLLHAQLIKATGGMEGIRDEGLLDSAILSPFQSFDGKELYPSVLKKGALLGFGLIQNHAFIDGNKRIGMYVMLAFLQVNGLPIHPTNDEVARVGLAVAAGKMDYPALLAWVQEQVEYLENPNGGRYTIGKPGKDR